MSESVLLADDHPVDPDDELLVAYLDGELAEPARKQVEKRLVEEAEFQKRLQALQTGWEWLEELPGEPTDEKLVESTIELVVADIAPAKRAGAAGRGVRGWFARRWKMIAVAVAVAGGIALGAAGTLTARRLALRRELAELALAEHHEAYKFHRSGNDFSLYRELAYNPDFNAMVDAMQRIGGRELVTPSVISQIPLEQRADALAELPTDERKRLTTRWETYRNYDAVTKRQIRDTAALVERQDDSDRLLRTMKAASVWIEGLPEDLRDELASDDARVRQAAINDAIELTMAELERDSGKMISQETSDQIYLWLELMLKRRLEQSPQSAAMFEKLEERDPRRYAIFEHFLLRYLVDEPRSRGRGGGFGPRFAPPGFPRFGGPPPSSDAGQDGGPEAESRGDDGDAEGRDDRRSGGFPRIPPITDEELEELKNLLGPQALADLDAVTELFRRFLGEVAVHETLRTWATEAVRRNAPLVDAEEIDYLQRYLERDDRDVLDLSPPEAIRREVFERPRWYERPQRERRPRR